MDVNQAAKPVVYVETSVFSYLAARKSRNTATAVRQDITQEWWNRRDSFRLVVSDAVYREAERGDTRAANARLQLLAETELLAPSLEHVRQLTRRIIKTGSLPVKAVEDAGHVAVAAIAGADYLCSWNFRHLLNPAIRPRIEEICREEGFRPAIICTPEELLFV